MHRLAISLLCTGLAVSAARAAEVLDEYGVQQAEADFVQSAPASGLPELENEILLSQSGVDNYARIQERSSAQSRITVSQTGDNNAVGAFQGNGRNNILTVQQTGNFNYATVAQTGDNNLADVTQLNDENRLSLTQGNGDNIAQILQNGNSSLTLVQSGAQSAAITVEGAALGTITQTSPTLNMTVTGTP